MIDFDNEGSEALLIGSDDQAIRVLKGEDSLLELAERGIIQDLISIFESTFAYSLDNGAFGVY